MKRLRNWQLYWLTAGVVSFFAVAVSSLFTPFWEVSIPFFYMAAFSLWGVNSERRSLRRLNEERRWWTREKLGIPQEPLDPCCPLFGQTRTAHQDIRCTRDRTVEHLSEQAEWAQLLREPLDIDREEDA